MPTFKSGAFIQQCFASHPLSLNIKTLTTPDRIVVICTNCDLRHRVIIGTLTTRTAEQEGRGAEATDFFARCAAEHATELRFSRVDVVSDAVNFRCAACRRVYEVAVAEFETYHK